MSVERIVFIVAGIMVMLSVALTHFVHYYFIFFTLFIGANLFQSGFTKWCPLITILKKLGVATEAEQAKS